MKIVYRTAGAERLRYKYLQSTGRHWKILDSWKIRPIDENGALARSGVREASFARDETVDLTKERLNSKDREIAHRLWRSAKNKFRGWREEYLASDAVVSTIIWTIFERSERD